MECQSWQHSSRSAVCEASSLLLLLLPLLVCRLSRLICAIQSTATQSGQNLAELVESDLESLLRGAF